MLTKRARSPRRAAALILVGASAACSYDFDRVWQDPPPPAADSWRPPDAGPPPRDTGGPATPDAAWPPAPTTLPSLCYDGAQSASTVGCPAGWVAIAGATDCEGSAIERFGLSNDGTGWTVRCSGGGKPQFAEVICARGEGFRRISAQGSVGSPAVARCAAWEVVISGGCECVGGAVRTNDYSQGAESWACACDEAAAPLAHAVCFHASTATRLGRSVSRAPGGGALYAAVGCSQGVVLTGGCGADRALSALALGETDDSWVCAFSQPPTTASLTAICLTKATQPCR